MSLTRSDYVISNVFLIESGFDSLAETADLKGHISSNYNLLGGVGAWATVTLVTADITASLITNSTFTSLEANAMALLAYSVDISVNARSNLDSLTAGALLHGVCITADTLTASLSNNNIALLDGFSQGFDKDLML